jgi:hypothetical protein
MGAWWWRKIERSKEGSRSDADAEDAGQTRGGAARGRRRTHEQTHGGAEISTNDFFLHFILFRSRDRDNGGACMAILWCGMQHGPVDSG